MNDTHTLTHNVPHADDPEEPIPESEFLDRLRNTRGITERQEVLKALWRLRRAKGKLAKRREQVRH